MNDPMVSVTLENTDSISGSSWSVIPDVFLEDDYLVLSGPSGIGSKISKSYLNHITISADKEFKPDKLRDIATYLDENKISNTIIHGGMVIYLTKYVHQFDELLVRMRWIEA